MFHFVFFLSLGYLKPIHLEDFLLTVQIKAWPATYSREAWASKRRLTQVHPVQSRELVAHNGLFLVTCTVVWACRVVLVGLLQNSANHAK